MAGLFSDVKRKNSETIAYLHGQDRQAMQKFIGQSPWEYGPQKSVTSVPLKALRKNLATTGLPR